MRDWIAMGITDPLNRRAAVSVPLVGLLVHQVMPKTFSATRMLVTTTMRLSEVTAADSMLIIPSRRRDQHNHSMLTVEEFWPCSRSIYMLCCLLELEA